MRSPGVATAVLLASLALTGQARAYFVIELTSGGELHADFVREEANGIHAARGSGEVRIERSRVRKIREVEPGVKLATTSVALEGAASSPSVGSLVPSVEPSFDPVKREAEVIRQIILGQRELLFARLRGDAPKDVANRERELKELKTERAAIQKLTSSSPR